MLLEEATHVQVQLTYGIVSAVVVMGVAGINVITLSGNYLLSIVKFQIVNGSLMIMKVTIKLINMKVYMMNVVEFFCICLGTICHLSWK